MQSMAEFRACWIPLLGRSGFPGAPWLASPPQRRRPWVISSATAACHAALDHSRESPPCSSSSSSIGWHQAGTDHSTRQQTQHVCRGAEMQQVASPFGALAGWAEDPHSEPQQQPNKQQAGAVAPVGGPHQADGLWCANAGGAWVSRWPKPVVLWCACRGRGGEGGRECSLQAMGVSKLGMCGRSIGGVVERQAGRHCSCKQRQMQRMQHTCGACTHACVCGAVDCVAQDVVHKADVV